MKHVIAISKADQAQSPVSHSGQLLQIIFDFVLDLVQHKGKGGEAA